MDKAKVQNWDAGSTSNPTLPLAHADYFHLLFEKNPVPTWVVDATSLRFLDVNEAAVQHYGYTHQEFLQLDLLRIRPPDQREKLETFVEAVKADPELLQRASQWRHAKKDGTVIEVKVWNYPFWFQDRLAIMGVVFDVTQQIRAEQELKENEERLRRLCDASFEGVAIHQDLIVRECNRAFLEMLGYETEAEVIGLHGLDFFAPECHELIKEKVGAKDETVYEAVMIKKSGERVPCEIRGRNIPYRGGMARCATVRNLTSERTHLARWREGEWQLEFLMNQVPACLWSVDKNLIITKSMGAGLASLGVKPNELVGKRLQTYLGTDDPQSESIRQHLRAISGESLSFETESKGVTFQTHLEPLRNIEGEIIGCIGVALDITNIKESDRILQATAAKLARSNRELEQFAHVISHDLQEPLRMISSYVSLIEKHCYEKLDEEAHKRIEFAVDGAKRMKALIDGLLDLSRCRGSRAVFRWVDLERLLQGVTRDLGKLIEETDAQVKISHPGMVWGDPAQLGQLFQNLLSNAIKFRKSNSPEIRISYSRKEDNFLFVVEDDGIGFDMQFSDRIFGIFQRLHTAAEYPGTGIGLAIAKRIVENHGGRIWAQSVPGQGTRMQFTLPRVT